MARKEERGFQYQKRSRADIQERANMKGGNFDSIFKPKFKQWKPKEGKNRIRVLPATWKGAKHYGLDVYVNYSIGPDKQAYLSLSKHEKGPDPLAEARREALKDGDKDYAKSLNPSQRILYWIVDRASEEEGPLLWAAPFTFDKSLANLTIDEDSKDVIELDEPFEGQDVRFYREGSGLATHYDASKMKLMGPAPVHEDEGQMEEWLNFVQDNPLPDVLNFYDYDHIKAQFDGQAGRTEDQEAEDETPKARTTKTKPKASADEDDEKPARASRKGPDAYEDEDDAKPAPRSARGAPVDDDDDEDEDEASPPRSARRKEPVEPKPRARSRVDDDTDADDADDSDDDSTKSSKANGSDERRSSLREKLAARRRSLEV